MPFVNRLQKICTLSKREKPATPANCQDLLLSLAHKSCIHGRGLGAGFGERRKMKVSFKPAGERRGIAESGQKNKGKCDRRATSARRPAISSSRSLGLSLPLSTRKERTQEERSASPALSLRNSGLYLSLKAAHVQTAARPNTGDVSQRTSRGSQFPRQVSSRYTRERMIIDT